MWSSVWRCSYADDKIERGPMMWMSSIIDGNKQKDKWLTIECRTISVPPKGSPGQVPMGDGMTMTSPLQL
jgi:hypothetical protein